MAGWHPGRSSCKPQRFGSSWAMAAAAPAKRPSCGGPPALSRCRPGCAQHSNLSFLCSRRTQNQAESSRPTEPGTTPRRPCEETDSRASEQLESRASPHLRPGQPSRHLYSQEVASRCVPRRLSCERRKPAPLSRRGSSVIAPRTQAGHRARLGAQPAYPAAGAPGACAPRRGGSQTRSSPRGSAAGPRPRAPPGSGAGRPPPARRCGCSRG